MQDRQEQASQLERLRKLLSSQPPTSNDGVEAVVGMLLIEKTNNDLEILLEQRAERTGDPWSGHIGLPGGRIKSSDKSPFDACKREVMEEVGIDLSREGELLGSLTPGFPWNRPELKVQPLIYKLHKRPILRIGSEVVSAFWVALSELPGMRKQSDVSTRLGPRTVDSFYVDGRVVWGFTFRVLNELLSLKQRSSG
ncbi:CoA pyrophosphatase [Candidatus Bathyarchaeota archaeon]|nr:MAG: CoA pyrophosphatase [Candidatus Bathyarchaeota archaeon]